MLAEDHKSGGMIERVRESIRALTRPTPAALIDRPGAPDDDDPAARALADGRARGADVRPVVIVILVSSIIAIFVSSA